MSGKYLFVNDIFFPSITNIQIFNKHTRSVKNNSIKLDKIIHTNPLSIDRIRKIYLSTLPNYKLLLKNFENSLNLNTDIKILEKYKSFFLNIEK